MKKWVCGERDWERLQITPAKLTRYELLRDNARKETIKGTHIRTGARGREGKGVNKPQPKLGAWAWGMALDETREL